MASTTEKRQSIGNKVSAPKLGSQGPGELDTALGKAIGAKVKITTSAPHSATLEGVVFTACPITNIVALSVSSSPTSTTSTSFASTASTTSTSSTASNQPSTYHLIPVSLIQSFSIISLPEAPQPIESSSNSHSNKVYFENAVPSVSTVDIKQLQAREQAAIQKIRERDAMRGKGVSKEAQEIFDALARTLPVRWHETTIIVSDQVMIAKPYMPENCSAAKGQQNALERVKKVLENERRKIAERNVGTGAGAVGAQGGSKAPPSAWGRKGG